MATLLERVKNSSVPFKSSFLLIFFLCHTKTTSSNDVQISDEISFVKAKRILDTGCWILDTGYWSKIPFERGCWIEDAGCRMEDI